MNVKILMENTNGAREDIIAEHGLSIYIETDKHTLMLDSGASSKTFINADLMGVDVSKVDTFVLSHGHYDHSGGVMTFTDRNKSAKIYIHENAGLDYFHKYINEDGSDYQKYIGIDKEILKLDNVVEVSGKHIIDDELSLFSDIYGRRLWPESNKILTMKKDEEYVQDEFNHEMCLVINHNGKYILLSGCAHNGILNILDKFKEIYHAFPDYVFSGFHMMKATDYTEAEIDNIEKTATELSRMNTIFYSGHCTGDKAMIIMKNIMKDKLVALHSGDEYQI